MAELQNDTGTLEAEDLVTEPLFKYKRMTNNFSEILKADALTCITVHDKFIAVGTYWGNIHIMDHQVEYEVKKLTPHSTRVNHISIDECGDHIASCSDDGKVIIQGLYGTENNQMIPFDRPIKAVAISPDYKSTRQFVTGDDRLILVFRVFLGRHKTEVLHQGEGPIHLIQWHAGYIAWANDRGVKVYDMRERHRITHVQRPDDTPSPDQVPCIIHWCNDTTFMIGWGRTVFLCQIKTRVVPNASSTLSGSSIASLAAASGVGGGIPTIPSKFVEITRQMTLPNYVSGLVPHLNTTLVLLYQGSCSAGQTVQKGDPESSTPVYILATEWNDKEERGYRVVSSDPLQISGGAGLLCRDFRLVSIPGENTHFVVAGREMTCIQEPSLEDRLDWLMEHDLFQQALSVVRGATAVSASGSRYNPQYVGTRYIQSLLQQQKFPEAARICSEVLTDKACWEDQVFTFSDYGQLACLAPHLPLTKPQLDCTIYELLMKEFLRSDPSKLLDLLRTWPPHIYTAEVIVHAVVSQVRPSAGAGSGSDTILHKCLALLYEHTGQYEQALNIYLRLRDPCAFDLIVKRDLMGSVRQKLLLLIDIDSGRALTLLVNNLQKNTVARVVTELKSQPEFLLMYLDVVNSKDSAIASVYHDQLVKLYADYAPNKLLPFLRGTCTYRLDEALRLCKEKKFIEESVYLMGRMGQNKDALQLIMSQGDEAVHRAIAYSKEQGDSDLWEELIRYAADKPKFIQALLENTGMDIDPKLLICRIQPKMDIPDLKRSLIKLLNDYQVQVNLRDRCLRILLYDVHKLFERQVRGQRRAICVKVPEDLTCQLCGAVVGLMTSSAGSAACGHGGFVVFYCHHMFHRHCLTPRVQPSTPGGGKEAGGIYQCPLCMPDRSLG